LVYAASTLVRNSHTPSSDIYRTFHGTVDSLQIPFIGLLENLSQLPSELIVVGRRHTAPPIISREVINAYGISPGEMLY
jgi:hypothetical protein